MPLSEFLRMAGRTIESGQQKPSQTDLSSRSANDLVELVWENGQIIMQGQSSRAARGSALNNSPLNTNKARDSRIGKFSGVESILNDMSPAVPSGDLDMSQDDEMVPWLDALAQDYGSVLLPEISGVTANGITIQNSFASVDRRSSCEQTINNLHSGGGSSKAYSSKARFSSSWATPHHSHTSDIISNDNMNNRSDVLFGNSAQGRDTVNDSAGMKMERQNIGPPSNNCSNYLNFSHFARPVNFIKAKIPSSVEISPSVASGMDIKEKSSAAGGNPVKSTLVEQFNSVSSAALAVAKDSGQQPVGKATNKDPCPIERAENLCPETSVKNDKPSNLSTDSAKGVPNGERTVEPVVASSSVGSGNSADRVSCEHTHNSKRKFRDTDSECPSDDVETESVGLKKTAPARGSGSKRSRAAEVHNLSERRRRDRINEKMRALQELIPNCNKADKASMLDEAIEYLKTLQLQVQIMSMGAGLYMPPMMFPPGMQHMHPAHIPHFSPMGVGMGMGMGYGMGMLDMNGGAPVFPVSPLQAPHFSGSVPTNFQRMPGPNVPVYGHPGLGLPNSVPRVPSVPLTTQPPILSNGNENAVPSTSPILNSGDITNANVQLNGDAEAGSFINQKSNQLNATNEVLNQSATVQENKKPTDTSGHAALTSTTETDISKEPGFD